MPCRRAQPSSTASETTPYNRARIHKTLRVTPAMEAGVADHVRALDEIARLAN
jgi:hypothetical protein